MLNNYTDYISELKNFDKTDILCNKFLIEENDNLKIFYAPHNEYINSSAKILVVGICPGWTQTQIAYKTAFEGLTNNLFVSEIQKQCKLNSRFAGSMRKNLIDMMNELQIHKYLNLENCSQLFDKDCTLLHTTSVIPYPIFINGKNYTGHNPELSKSKILIRYVEQYFYPEAQYFNNALIIPLGKSVDDILKDMCNRNILNHTNILFGFPHTSGANGHRRKQFEENKEFFNSIITEYFE